VQRAGRQQVLAASAESGTAASAGRERVPGRTPPFVWGDGHTGAFAGDGHNGQQTVGNNKYPHVDRLSTRSPQQGTDGINHSTGGE
jgi:hypothetical protein